MCPLVTHSEVGDIAKVGVVSMALGLGSRNGFQVMVVLVWKMGALGKA